MVCEGCSNSWWCVVAKWLLVIGGLNWGIVGIGMIAGSAADWNIVRMILGGIPAVEAIVYILVGAAAVAMIFCQSCFCKKASAAPSGDMGQQAM